MNSRIITNNPDLSTAIRYAGFLSLQDSREYKNVGLDLSGYELTTEKLATFLEALDLANLNSLNRPTITSLNLSGCKIGDEGVELLADFLKSDRYLSALNLEENNISINGATTLAQALKENKRLNHLSLRNNAILAGGVGMLADALTQNTTLYSLDLTGCNINETVYQPEPTSFEICDKGTTSLAEALKKNKTLTALVLSANYLDEDDQGALQEINKLIEENKKQATPIEETTIINSRASEEVKNAFNKMAKTTQLAPDISSKPNNDDEDYKNAFNIQYAKIMLQRAIAKVLIFIAAIIPFTLLVSLPLYFRSKRNEPIKKLETTDDEIAIVKQKKAAWKQANAITKQLDAVKPPQKVDITPITDKSPSPTKVYLVDKAKYARFMLFKNKEQSYLNEHVKPNQINDSKAQSKKIIENVLSRPRSM